MDTIVGKWEQPAGQPYPGLWFQFKDDGTFQAEYSEMGIESSGSYNAVEGAIDMDQTQHTLGLIGKFIGVYRIDGDMLTMNLADPGGPRPADVEGKNKRIYKRVG